MKRGYATSNTAAVQKNDGRCFSCREFGHFSRECPSHCYQGHPYGNRGSASGLGNRSNDNANGVQKPQPKALLIRNKMQRNAKYKYIVQNINKTIASCDGICATPPDASVGKKEQTNEEPQTLDPETINKAENNILQNQAQKPMGHMIIGGNGQKTLGTGQRQILI